MQSLARQLLEESKKLVAAESPESEQENAFGRSNVLVTSRLQKEKVKTIMDMVEREGTVIEAVMARLERLNV